MFLDELGELCAWRVTEIVSLDQTLAGLDALISAAVLEELASQGDAERLHCGRLDETSRALAEERALAGGSWIRWQDGRLALDWPISPEAAARAFEILSAPGDDKPLAPWFLSQIAGLSVGAERAVLAFGSEGGAALDFAPPASDELEGPDEALIAAVRSAGLAVGDEASFEHRVDVLTRLRWPEPGLRVGAKRGDGAAWASSPRPGG